MEKNTALDTLETAHIDLIKAQVATEKAVHAARGTGASWAEIGKILGISKQAVQQRYGKGPSKELLTADHLEDTAAIALHEARYGTKAATIVDEDRAGDSVTPSIFLEPQAPAKPFRPGMDTWTDLNDSTMPDYANPHGWSADDWQQDNPKHFQTPMEGRPSSCPFCGARHHRLKGGTWIYPGCTPTDTDPSYTS